MQDDAIPIGRDGAAMLALSVAIMVGSLGLTPFAVLLHVCRVARGTPTRAEETPDRILVLGKRLSGGAVSAEYCARLDRAAALHRRAPGSCIVVLGGHTGPGPSEAAAGRDYLVSRGIAHGAILIEERSRHTLENLHHYRADHGLPGGRTVLVTSRYHLARSTLTASGLGLVHSLCAAEDRWVPPARLVLWEALLVHWYLAGSHFARLTRNRRMADRIS